MITVGVPVRGQVGYAAKAIESVLRCNSLPTQVIIVDDSSEPAVYRRLGCFKDMYPDIKLIRNKYREGFAYNANIILDESKGDMIVLLNSDAVVTCGWDAKLSEALSEPGAGLAGPSTSCAHTPQALLEYRFDRLGVSDEEIQRRGESVSIRFKGKRERLRHLGGFCLAISRNAFKEVGYFDERFGLGPFEENDFADRTNRKGLRVEWIKDVYVHHFGGRSFNGDGPAFYRILREESESFYDSKRKGDVACEWVRREGEGRLDDIAEHSERYSHNENK